MKKAKVFVNDIYAAELIEIKKGSKYQLIYDDAYQGQSVSLTMPCSKKVYDFDQFPPFFEGLLPEGFMLEALLRKAKIDKYDFFEQLMRVGEDMVGNVTVKKEEL
jgi:serine/threonine-protein kinase HipA